MIIFDILCFESCYFNLCMHANFFFFLLVLIFANAPQKLEFLVNLGMSIMVGPHAT